MGRYSRSQVFLDFAYCLFIFLVVDSRAPLSGGVLKLIAWVAFAFLLAFVVVHSANIRKLLVSRLHVFSEFLLPFDFDRRWSGRTQITIAVPNEPSLSSLFQRPPPFLA
jgi:hypothetical protein